MQFASLMSLWFALALPAILIMYLFKRHYIDKEVASHMLWKRVMKDMEANRPWQKLRSSLLLLLQLMIAALLVLALMQPFVWAKEKQQEHVVIIIDQSASMAALVDSDVSRFQLAKQQAKHIIERARGRQLTLIGLSAQPQVLATRESDRQRVIALVEAMTINYGYSAERETMSFAAALTHEDEAEVHLLSDGQWVAEHDATFSVPLIVHQLGSETEGNVGIAQFGVRHDPAAADAMRAVTAVATIVNWGADEMVIEATLFAEQREEQSKAVTIAPNEHKVVFFNDMPPAPYYKLAIAVDDALFADNVSFAFIEDGEPSTALLLSSGNIFLEKALALSDVIMIKAQQDNAGVMVLPRSDVDFIIIDAISPPAIDTDNWRALLRQKPLWFIAYGEGEQEKVHPLPPYRVSDHAITEHIQFQDVHIAEALVDAELDWGEAIVSAGRVPLLYAGHVAGVPRVLYTFQLQRSDLPLRAEFPVLVRNTVAWLNSEHAPHLGRAIAGETMELSLATATHAVRWEAVALSDGVEGTVSLEAEAEVSHMQTVPPVPGLYRFVEQDAAGKIVQQRLLHVIMDMREANIAPATQHERDEVSDQAQQTDAGEVVTARSIIPLLVVAILLLLALEWEVYRRGSAF